MSEPRFAGFPERGLIFYEGLEADNSKAYWTDHRPVYEECVRAPMEALLAELEPDFGPGKLFRPYRDVRFSKDKTPYKTQAAGWVTGAGGAAGGFYVALSAAGLFVAGGYYDTTADQVERLRRAVADDVRGAELERVLAGLRRAGCDVSGDRLKTTPRGYPADHHRIDLLRHRSLTAGRHWPAHRWLHTRTALDRVRAAWRDIAPLNRWLDDNVGPPAAAPRTRGH